jgi:hypothetical protein
VETHHGRPGGRLLELVLVLVLVALSLGLMAGFGALVSYEFGLWGDGRASHGADSLVRAFVFAALVCAAAVLSYLWASLLKYYRYDTHTLRPLPNNNTTTPGEGHENKEG